MYEEYTKEYTEYLNSEAWQKKRDACFKAKGKACQKCGNIENLHVHHATYKRIFKENIKYDLYVLCTLCHDIYHKITKANTIQNTLRYIANIETRRPRKYKWRSYTMKSNTRQSVLRKY